MQAHTSRASPSGASTLMEAKLVPWAALYSLWLPSQNGNFLLWPHEQNHFAVPASIVTCNRVRNRSG